MSLYVIKTLAPPRTLAANPISFPVSVTEAFVERCEILFPDGCKGAVGIRLFDRASQFAPAPPLCGWIYGDGETVEWREQRQLEGPPYQLRIEVHNDAREHPHTPEVRIEVVRYSLERIMADVRDMLSAIIRKKRW